MTKVLSLLCGLVLVVLPVHATTTVLDLINGDTANGTAAIGLGFQVDWINQQSTGTGVIDSFVKIQQNGEERGYNTDFGTPLDDNGAGFTRALTFGEIPTVTIGGVLYRQFLLDINQNNSNPLLSLNQIQIFESSTDLCPADLGGGSQTGCGSQSVGTGSLQEASNTTDALISFAGATEIFRMNNQNATNRYEIQLNFDRNPGSGAGDMFLYVRDTAFTNQNPSENIILFSQFGNPHGQYASNDGFEEWAVLTAPIVPEPASVLMLMTVLGGVGWAARRRRTA